MVSRLRFAKREFKRTFVKHKLKIVNNISINNNVKRKQKSTIVKDDGSKRHLK